GQWNRNERATLSIAGLAMLATVLAYQRTAVPIITTLVIAVAGIAPLPRMARGAISLAAGLAVLWDGYGPAAAGGLAILPGALLTRAKSPASKLAQLWGSSLPARSSPRIWFRAAIRRWRARFSMASRPITSF